MLKFHVEHKKLVQQLQFLYKTSDQDVLKTVLFLVAGITKEKFCLFEN